MTATLSPARTAAAADAPSWNLVAEGLWAGTRDGEFVGTVEFVAGGFETVDHHGVRVGRSHSLPGAQRLLIDPDATEPAVLDWRDGRVATTSAALLVASLTAAAVGLAVFLFG